jgi:hypothetical protein
MSKTTSYPDKTIEEQINDLDHLHDETLRMARSNNWSYFYIGLLSGIIISWTVIWCYFYFGHH